MAQDERTLHIVGIGASAGGLTSLQQFFEQMPCDTGMAFVVIQHLSHDFKSQMAEILANHTPMPIREVADGMPLAPDTVYLNVSMTQMSLDNGRLWLTEVPQDERVNLPIDVFFSSLARQARELAVGVIMSGTGRDGSEGVKTIHDCGGLVVVQSPASCQFDAMPQSAIATGACHLILPPAEMPAVIREHAAHPLPLASDAPQQPEIPGNADDYAEIFDLLQHEYQLDFSRYKMGTVGRRIRRRMDYRRVATLSEYVRIVSADQQELDALYHDLLIGVTEFFRDEHAFQYLEHRVIPKLFANLAQGQELRAWCAGCATGEEAYSLAILLAEKGSELGFPGKITVFATDVHKRSLDTATQGLYSRDRLEKVSAERLQRFFVQTDRDLFKVSPELRRLLIFAEHDLTRDIPFSRLDLVCCRNLLIYLQPQTQKKVLARFQFALKVNGILFLGKSEGLGSYGGEFEAISAPNKIFQKTRDLKFSVDLEPGRTGHPLVVPRADLPTVQVQPAGVDRRVLHDYDVLLEQHLPPGVLVDENFHILHCFGQVARFLKGMKGRFDPDILQLTDDNLHIALSTSLLKVKKTGQGVVTRNIRLQTAQDEYLLDLTVNPIPYERDGTLHYHIYFEQIRQEPVPSPEPPQDGGFSTFEPGLYYRQHLCDLEFELQSTRADLLASRENLQSVSEALNATNEALQSTNEELQSTNEELNSANEELHSTNEELYSVNTEFERSNIELKALNTDLQNLLTSIDSGIIFLDKQMHIRKFNPAISAFFKLLPQDVGRPIDHIAFQLDSQKDLLADIERVLNDELVIEKEITKEQVSLLCRIIPFRSETGSKEGVVIIFTDLSRVKEAERLVITLNEELGKRVMELEETYGRLEEETNERIRVLEELRLKDQLMIQQSRLAAMGEMLGNIAHQWRQPLNVLGLQVQELGMAYRTGRFSGEMLASGVAKSMKIIQHMSQTIDDFRDFLLQDKEKKPFAVDAAIRKAASIIEAGLQQNDIALEIESSGDPQIVGHANEFGQVILNILMNAKDAFGAAVKSGALIAIRSFTENGKAVVTVTDNAGGIDEAIIAKVFDAYFTTKELGKGTGVGLFMSNNIIEKSMGGRLTAHNVPGGAQFRIEV